MVPLNGVHRGISDNFLQFGRNLNEKLCEKMFEIFKSMIFNDHIDETCGHPFCTMSTFTNE